MATSTDDSVLAALEHAQTYQVKRRDFIPMPAPVDGDDPESGIAFASQNWRRVVTDRRRPGMVARRHFEVMVFTYLAEELPAIYGEQAAAVVVFVSAEYVTRDWTRLERRAALDRAVRERQESVLPARFDDTPVPGLLAGMVAVDLRGRTPEQFADLVVEKLADLAISPSPPGGADRGPPGGVRVSAADPRRLACTRRSGSSPG